MIHELKTWPRAFEAVISGIKTHEVRSDDRDYRVGDLLHLREWMPAHEGECSLALEWGEPRRQVFDIECKVAVCGRRHRIHETGTSRRVEPLEPRRGAYTGREAVVRVTYKTEGGTFGLPPGMCVMSVKLEERSS